MYGLHDKKWSVEQIESNLNWYAIPRTYDGWIFPEGHALSPSMKFQTFHGFKVNLNTGEIRIFSSSGKHGIFGWSDIKEVLENDE